MSDIVTASLFFVIGMAAILAIAYLLDRRRKVSQPIEPVHLPLGPTGRIFLWITRGLVAIMILAMVGALTLRSLPLAWLAAGCAVLGLVNGFILEAVRLAGR